MQDDIPARFQLAEMLSHRFAQPAFQPVPFHRAPQGAGNGQPDPARRFPVRPRKGHEAVQAPALPLRVHFTIIGGAQQARTLGKPELSFGRPQSGLPGHGSLLRRGDGQAFASLPASPGENCAPAHRLHSRPKTVGLGPLPFFWLIRPLRHAAGVSSGKFGVAKLKPRSYDCRTKTVKGAYRAT